MQRELLLPSQNSSVLLKCLCFGCIPIQKGLRGRIGILCTLQMVCDIDAIYKRCAMRYETIMRNIQRGIIMRGIGIAVRKVERTTRYRTRYIALKCYIFSS